MKTYEEKFEELKKINERLTATDIPLAEVVELYEQAQTLMNELKTELEHSRLVVEHITNNMKEEK